MTILLAVLASLPGDWSQPNQDVRSAGDRQAAATRSGGVSGFLRKTEVIGVADAYYGYNANGTSDIEFRNFDTRGDQMSLSMAKVGVAKAVDGTSRFGFRVDVQGGRAATLIHSAEPSPNAALRHLEQAYVSYLAPIGKGLQVDAGEFVTPLGAEVIEARDNWNYSRSLLFALAIPYYHAGVRATYAFNDKVSLAGLVVNGWNDIVDNNGGKSYGAQFTWKPTARLSVVQNYLGGPEQPHDTQDWRHISDTVVTYTLTSALSVMANYDYGHDSIAGAPVRWQGVAGYVRYQITQRFAVSPRVEWYDDPTGFTSGTPQALREVTATGEMKLGAGFLWRLEYRHDASGVGAFRTQYGDFVRGQTTLAGGLLYSFDRKGKS